MRFILLSFVALLISCAETRVRNEEGRGRYSVRCLDSVLNCHEKARSTCGDGYVVTNRVRPTKYEDRTEFTLRVKCRHAMFE